MFSGIQSRAFLLISSRASASLPTSRTTRRLWFGLPRWLPSIPRATDNGDRSATCSRRTDACTSRHSGDRWPGKSSRLALFNCWHWVRPWSASHLCSSCTSVGPPLAQASDARACRGKAVHPTRAPVPRPTGKRCEQGSPKSGPLHTSASESRTPAGRSSFSGAGRSFSCGSRDRLYLLLGHVYDKAAGNCGELQELPTVRRERAVLGENRDADTFKIAADKIRGEIEALSQVRHESIAKAVGANPVEV